MYHKHGRIDAWVNGRVKQSEANCREDIQIDTREGGREGGREGVVRESRQSLTGYTTYRINMIN